jgi:hypothetical protein
VERGCGGEWEFELEVNDGDTELEIDMKWSDTPQPDESRASTQTAAMKPAAAERDG